MIEQILLVDRKQAWKIGSCHSSRKVSDESLAGADPRFFLGGGASLGNDVTHGEVKKS